jgi:hypothetical protein
MEFKFSRQIFRKILTYWISWNPSGGSRVVPCGWTDGQTDRHDEANSRLSQFCERTYNVLASNVPYKVPVHVWDNYNYFRNWIFLQAKLLGIICCMHTSIAFQDNSSYRNATMPTFFWFSIPEIHIHPQHDNFIMAVFKILLIFMPIRITSSERTIFLWNYE